MTVCGAKNLNAQVLFYNVHDSYFYDRAIHILCSNQIKPFMLKASESVNDQSNDSVINLNMKGIHGHPRMKWQRQHGNLKFTSAHMNALLV